MICYLHLLGCLAAVDRLRFVAERSLIGEGREALLSVVCPERPGAFKQLYSVIYPRAVTEFSYHLRDMRPMATEISSWVD